jgi:hypothetical protein
MNGGLLPLLSEAQTAEALRRASDRRQLRTAQGRRHADLGAIVRMAGAADSAALERLSQLEGRRLPAGPALVAEHDGEVLAAVGLAGGEPIADPFRPTAELVELLGRALAHLREQNGSRRWSVWGLLGRRRYNRSGVSAPTVPGNELTLIR